jgi:hypothetical protein
LAILHGLREDRIAVIVVDYEEIVVSAGRGCEETSREVAEDLSCGGLTVNVDVVSAFGTVGVVRMGWGWFGGRVFGFSGATVCPRLIHVSEGCDEGFGEMASDGGGGESWPGGEEAFVDRLGPGGLDGIAGGGVEESDAVSRRLGG